MTSDNLVDLVTPNRSSGGQCDMKMRDTLLRQETFISTMVIRSIAGLGHNRLPGPRNKTDQARTVCLSLRSQHDKTVMVLNELRLHQSLRSSSKRTVISP